MSEDKKEILLGDCLELMKDIPNGSVDMILCDLPYGTTACMWDTIIPFDKLWEQYERIIKPNGAIVLTASQPFTSALVMSNPKLFKYEWIWEKAVGSNFAVAKYQPLKEHENILVFSKGKTIYNPIKEERKGSGKARLKNGYKSNGTSTEVYGGLQSNRMGKEYEDLKYPSSVQYFNNRDKDRGMHPTQKPIELFEYLIKTYTNENETVLDNCAGSGTTAIACLNTNRQFIVMEKEQKYYDIILKRVGDFNKKFETQTLFGNEM
jgi:site-specific DNA-methyltransferase (adenine-specific)